PQQGAVHGGYGPGRAAGAAAGEGAAPALGGDVQGAQHLGRVSRFHGRDLHDLAQPHLAARLLRARTRPGPVPHRLGGVAG
nr:hypothetical protein [Tanacetum cinerariifolium]